jgi:hypothetical protein
LIFVEAYQAGQTNRLSEYFINSFPVQLDARPRVRQGSPLPFQIIMFCWGSMSGIVSFSDMWALQCLELELVELRLGNETLAFEPDLGHSNSMGSSGGGHFSDAAYAVWGRHWIAGIDAPPLPRAEAPVGVHTLTARLRIRWARWDPRMPPTRADMEALGLPTSWEVTVSQEVEIVPTDVATVTTVKSDEARDAFLSTMECSISDPFDEAHFSFDRRDGSVVGTVPLDFAFDLRVEDVEGEQAELGVLVFSERWDFIHGRARLPDRFLHDADRDADRRLTVALTPSVEIAQRTPFVERMWIGDPIRLEVPIPQFGTAD